MTLKVTKILIVTEDSIELNSLYRVYFRKLLAYRNTIESVPGTNQY